MLKTEVEKQRNFQRQLHQQACVSRQSTLLLLYHFLRVYGTTHKGNVDIAVSCTTLLWKNNFHAQNLVMQEPAMSNFG